MRPRTSLATALATTLIAGPALADVDVPIAGIDRDDQLILGDFNGDRVIDVAVGIDDGTGGSVQVQYGVPTDGWAPDFTLNGTVAEPIGKSIANAGDVNGDGIDDLLVGIGFDGAQLFFGSPSGLHDFEWAFDVADLDVTFGAHVTHGGDLNGDGFYDVVVGISGFDDPDRQGGIYVFYGDASFGGTVSELDADWSIFGPPDGSSGSEFAQNLCGGGDVNGDGFHDLLAGDPSSNFDGVTRRGAVYTFLGGPSGINPVELPQMIFGVDGISELGRNLTMVGDIDADGHVDAVSEYDNGFRPLWGDVDGLRRGDYVGANGEVQPAGDFDGDGFADFAVTRSGTDATVFSGSVVGVTDDTFSIEGDLDAAGTMAPAVMVDGGGRYRLLALTDGALRGYRAVGMLDPDTFVRLTHMGAPGERRWVEGIGDVDGDGLSDVAIYHNEPPTVDVYSGRRLTGESASPMATITPGSFELAGCDVNGDGFSDLVHGVTPGEGEVQVYYGSPTGIGDAPDVIVRGDDQTLNLGEDVRAIGDVNGDGFDDVAVTSCHDTPCYVMVFYGSEDGFAGDPLYDWRIDTPNDKYEGGDVNGDGYDDFVYADRDGISLWYGGPSGLPPNPTLETADWREDGEFLTRDVIVTNWFGTFHDDIVIVELDGETILYLGGPGDPVRERLPAPEERRIHFRGANVLGDVDGDGYDEIIGFIRSTGGEVIYGPGGEFQASTSIYAANGVGDVNGDGRGDYVTLPDTPGTFGVALTGTNIIQPALWSARQHTALAEPIAPGGMISVEDTFMVSATFASPVGQTRARMEIELKPEGIPFDGLDTVLSNWVDTPLPNGEVQVRDVEVEIPDLVMGGAYRWRARMLFDSHLAYGAWHGLEVAPHTNIAVRVFDPSVPIDPTPSPTGVTPAAFSVGSPSPNPFGAVTSLAFAVPIQDRVTVDVFDVAGRRVARVADEIVAAGTYRLTWDGLDAGGRGVASGVYSVVLRSGAEKVVRRVVLAR